MFGLGFKLLATVFTMAEDVQSDTPFELHQNVPAFGHGESVNISGKGEFRQSDSDLMVAKYTFVTGFFAMLAILESRTESIHIYRHKLATPKLVVQHDGTTVSCNYYEVSLAVSIVSA